MDVSNQVDTMVESLVRQIIQKVQDEAVQRAKDYVTRELSSYDVRDLVRQQVRVIIEQSFKDLDFPTQSIPLDAVRFGDLKISADVIDGGTIREFNSTGIQDLSSTVQMTLLDTAVVIENHVITQGLTVKGSTALEGDLVINGTVPPESTFYQSIIENAVAGVKQELDPAFFDDYSSVIFNQIREEGIDLNRITLNGTEVILENKLNYGITDSNLQRVGRVVDLQTLGESYLSETLYIGKNRVGVNTLSPGHSLSVWDQEVEIGFGKQQRDQAWIGTPRAQSLVLSANNNDNIVLGTDGSVTVRSLTVNQVQLTSSPGAPKDSLPVGTVAFNEKPGPGKPVGWVSLGNGSWSAFGTVR
jgi:hypothetical protein